MKVVQRKVCMLGSFAVGKTSLVRRFVEGKFDDRYLSTIGVKISRKTVTNSELTYDTNLIVWDLAGGDEFLRSNSSYLRGAAGALVICDLTRAQTLTAAEQYAHQIRSLNSGAGVVLIANKVDLVEERVVEEDKLAAVAAAFEDCPVYLTSAKTGENVEVSFTQLAQIIGRK